MRADTNAEITLGELMDAGATDIPVWSLDERMQAGPAHAHPCIRERCQAGVRADPGVRSTDQSHWKSPVPDPAMAGARSRNCRSKRGSASLRHVPPPVDVVARDDDEVITSRSLAGRRLLRASPADPVRQHRRSQPRASATRPSGNSVWSPQRDEYAAARVTTLRLPAPYPADPWPAESDRGLAGRLTASSACAATRSSCRTGSSDCRSSRSACSFDTSGRPTDPSRCAQVQSRRTHLLRLDKSASRRRCRPTVAALQRLQPRIKRGRKSGYRDGYHLYIYGVENQLRFCDEIGVHGLRGHDCCRVGGAAA